jgi:hypothetical protein
MHDVLETFVEDLRRSRFVVVADQIEDALRATDMEADYNPHAAAMFEAITWIVGHTGRSLTERVLALIKLVEHDGSEIQMRRFTGWRD